jgi:hypothetical protein
MTANYINLVGLCYDIAGGFFLARAVALNSTAKISKLVSTGWGYSKHLIPAYLEQRNDGIVGFALLAIGFILQGMSDFYLGEASYLYAGLSALAALLVGYVLVARKLVTRQSEKVVAHIEAKIAKGEPV